MSALALPPLEPHHAASIRNLVAEFERDASVLALVLGGSLAHGFARPDSDIDVAIVLDPAVFQRRKAEGRLHYNNRALCTYDGYIDGKYMDLDFLRLVASRGSDPARYAFKDSRILFSRIEGLASLLAEIVRYPADQVAERTARFAAQLLAWRWYYSEAIRQESPYLTCLALQKVTLFSCRLVLAQNEMLFPYHKWLLRVAGSAPRRPAGFPANVQRLLTDHSWEKVDRYCREIITFAGMDFADADSRWPTRFMKDTELKWMTVEPPIDDL
jgi:predicted nucleotidyltransferase